MELNGEVAKLVINDAYPEDSGDYSCEVSNGAGQQTASFRLTIKGFNFRINFCLLTFSDVLILEKKGKMKRMRPKETEEDKRKSVSQQKPEEEKKTQLKKPEVEEKRKSVTQLKKPEAAPELKVPDSKLRKKSTGEAPSEIFYFLK